MYFMILKFVWLSSYQNVLGGQLLSLDMSSLEWTSQVEHSYVTSDFQTILAT